MGLASKILNPGNVRGMLQIAKLSNRLSQHIKKRCGYCELDLGIGDDYPVVDFVKHLSDEHRDKIDPQDIKTYEKLIKKVLG